MTRTLGQKITEARKAKGLTQDELAEILEVSPQAVSKWENDISCPDITILPRLSKVLGVSIDSLLSNEMQKETYMVPAREKKDPNTLILKIIVDSAAGDKVRVNLPFASIKMGLDIGIMEGMSSGGNGMGALKNLDLDMVVKLVENGVVGKLVEVESAEGDRIEIFVE